MDQCMIDVTDVPDVKLGDEVIVMGTDGINTILADDIANATGTINYEITCAFGQRLPKVYVKQSFAAICRNMIYIKLVLFKAFLRKVQFFSFELA